MRVLMMIKSDAPSEAGVMPSHELLTAMGNYNERLFEANVMRGGEGLHPSSKGARVRIARGKTTIVDGPFTESKELLAGYFLMETRTFAEAIEWAKQLPCIGLQEEAHVELRPLYEPEDFPVDPAEQPGGWRDVETAQRAQPPKSGPEHGTRWMHLLKADRNTEAETTPAPSVELMQRMGALMEEMASNGKLIAGDGLKPTREGARVYFAPGKPPRVVDGPFSESKEIIAGFCMYRAHTKAEAIEWARRCLQIHVEGTGIDSGEIEVRPVMETEDIPVAPEEQAGGWRDQELRLRARIGQ